MDKCDERQTILFSNVLVLSQLTVKIKRIFKSISFRYKCRKVQLFSTLFRAEKYKFSALVKKYHFSILLIFGTE